MSKLVCNNPRTFKKKLTLRPARNSTPLTCTDCKALCPRPPSLPPPVPRPYPSPYVFLFSSSPSSLPPLLQPPPLPIAPLTYAPPPTSLPPPLSLPLHAGALPPPPKQPCWPRTVGV